MHLLPRLRENPRSLVRRWPADTRQRNRSLVFAPSPDSQAGVSRVGGTKRRRLCCVELLDENRGPHDELSWMRGEMHGVVDALKTAGRGRFRPSGVRAKAV